MARPPLGFLVDSAGAMVVRAVAPNSPAARAGLAVGDTIIAVAGSPATHGALTRAVAALAPGVSLVVGVRGAGREQRLSLAADGPALAATPRAVIRRDALARATGLYLTAACEGADSLYRPSSPPRPRILSPEDSARGAIAVAIPRGCVAGWGRPGASGVAGAGGIAELAPRARGGTTLALSGGRFMTLNATLARYFPGTSAGVLVLEVEAGSDAERSGLAPGDVIAGANGAAVRGVADIIRALRVAEEGARGDRLEFAVVRHGSARRMTLVHAGPSARR
ncbi:MAG: PDZ domain-containing protein [Gemmatimonadaceae bacterium]